MSYRGSVGNEFREFIRRLQKLDSQAERLAKRQQRREAKKNERPPRVPPKGQGAPD